MRDKTPNDPRGSKLNCPNFEQCPFCYGCRNYSTSDMDCQICLEENKKINLCKKDIHKPELISRMITRNKINLEDKPC